jgi:hypothetical protein
MARPLINMRGTLSQRTIGMAEMVFLFGCREMVVGLTLLGKLEVACVMFCKMDNRF